MNGTGADFRPFFRKRLASWNNFSQSQLTLLADCALAQAKHESANFGSDLCNRANNCIGYTFSPTASVLWRSGKDATSAYCAYPNIAACAGELADFIHRKWAWFADVEDPDGYADTMRQLEYYEDSEANYAAGMDGYYQTTDPADDPDAGQSLNGSDAPSTSKPGVLGQGYGWATQQGPVMAVLLCLGLALVWLFSTSRPRRGSW